MWIYTYQYHKFLRIHWTSEIAPRIDKLIIHSFFSQESNDLAD